MQRRCPMQRNVTVAAAECEEVALCACIKPLIDNASEKVVLRQGYSCWLTMHEAAESTALLDLREIVLPRFARRCSRCCICCPSTWVTASARSSSRSPSWAKWSCSCTSCPTRRPTTGASRRSPPFACNSIPQCQHHIFLGYCLTL